MTVCGKVSASSGERVRFGCVLEVLPYVGCNIGFSLFSRLPSHVAVLFIYPLTAYWWLSFRCDVGVGVVPWYRDSGGGSFWDVYPSLGLESYVKYF